MPTVRKKADGEVIAILVADLHLSLNPPLWRCNEPDWFEAMKRPLREIREIQEEYNCPVICAGDIFDRWSSLPELINFAFDYLPKMYAIPGQHDLPLHNYEDIKKSAYLSLVNADVIQNILPFTHKDFSETIGDMILYGFPFGTRIQPLVKRGDNKIHIAIVHKYVWIKGKSYPNAPKENKLGHGLHRITNQKWDGYDIIVYGDNHKGFQATIKNTVIFNCGTMMRRKSDEIDYKPQIGLLLKSGRIKKHYLDTSKDKYLEIIDKKTIDSLDMKSFIQELEKLGNSDLDFSDAMQQYLKKNKVGTEVANIIRKAMGL